MTFLGEDQRNVSFALGGSTIGKSRERSHPIEFAPYCNAEGRKVGGTAKNRKKQAIEDHVDKWTDRAVSLIKQLWKGTLNNDLMDSNASGFHWPEIQATTEGSLITKLVREKISIAVNARPQDFPKGEDALRRHQGVDSFRHLTTNREKSGQAVPKRGDTWPAVIEDIALPPGGTESTYVGKVSKVADAYLRDFRKRMLRTEEEIDELRTQHREEGTVPYVDANIQEGMLTLAVGMAKSGMLRGIKRKRYQRFDYSRL